eukprot:15454631-Alexandrium_andersonii.AAC.1
MYLDYCAWCKDHCVADKCDVFTEDRKRSKHLNLAKLFRRMCVVLPSRPSARSRPGFAPHQGGHRDPPRRQVLA